MGKHEDKGDKGKGDKGEWSAERLANYLRKFTQQIDVHVCARQIPTTDRLDAYISRLVKNIQRHLKHAPKNERHSLNTFCSKRFQAFWNFNRNEKVRTTTPENLRAVLVSVIDHLVSDYILNAAPVV